VEPSLTLLFSLLFTWVLSLTIWISRIDSKVSILRSFVIDSMFKHIVEKFSSKESFIRIKPEVVEKFPSDLRNVLDMLAMKYRKKLIRAENIDKVLVFLLKLVFKYVDRETVFRLSDLFNVDPGCIRLLLAIYIWSKARELKC